MTPVDAKLATWGERYSWKILIGADIIFALFGIGDILQGMSADPAIANSMTGIAWEELRTSSPRIASLIDLQVRTGGAQLVILAVLSGLICMQGYRRWERWAWYAQWTWPLFMAIIFLTFVKADRQPNFPPPPPMISAILFFLVFTLALLLPYRKFFPNEP